MLGEPLHPPIHDHMVDLDATLGPQLFDIAVGESVVQVPADRDRDHLRPPLTTEGCKSRALFALRAEAEIAANTTDSDRRAGRRWEGIGRIHLYRNALNGIQRPATDAADLHILYSRRSGKLRAIIRDEECRRVSGRGPEDDGTGFDVERYEHDSDRPLLGSVNVRLAALRGTLQVDAHPGRGTSIMATVPLPATEIDRR